MGIKAAFWGWEGTRGGREGAGSGVASCAKKLALVLAGQLGLGKLVLVPLVLVLQRLAVFPCGIPAKATIAKGVRASRVLNIEVGRGASRAMGLDL